MSAKKRLGFDLVRLAVLLLALTACTASPIETNVAPSAPPTIAPSATDAPTDTPTEVPTSTPIPTATSTPQPEWVADFAQPILDAIADRAPDFQDDFHDQSGGWHFENYCADWRMKYVDSELVVTVGAAIGTTVGNSECTFHRNDINYTNFVVEVDGRFLPGTATASGWRITFRLTQGEKDGIDYAAGDWIFIGYGHDSPDAHIYVLNGPHQDFLLGGPATQSIHLLVIARGQKFAFYADGKPLYYTESSYCPYGDISLGVSNYGNLQTDTVVAFDNFKIWDLSDLP